MTADPDPATTDRETLPRTPAEIAADVFRKGGSFRQVLDAALGPRRVEIEAEARAGERQRIRVAIDALTVALVRPGLGPAHQEAFHVVPLQELADLLDGDTP